MSSSTCWMTIRTRTLLGCISLCQGVWRTYCSRQPSCPVLFLLFLFHAFLSFFFFVHIFFIPLPLPPLLQMLYSSWIQTSIFSIDFWTIKPLMLGVHIYIHCPLWSCVNINFVYTWNVPQVLNHQGVHYQTYLVIVSHSLNFWKRSFYFHYFCYYFDVIKMMMIALIMMLTMTIIVIDIFFPKNQGMG